MNHSSGNILADRRAGYAAMFAENGDWLAAAGLMRDALVLAPDWTAGRFRLGEMLRGAGQEDAARNAFRDVLAADPEDFFGARLQLELLGQASGGGQSLAFVETLFDQYAANFETALVGKLAYRAPQALHSAIASFLPAKVTHAADLGCGTGLMGVLLRPSATRLSGFDVSAAMLAKAQAKGCYDRLEKADIAVLALDEPAQLVTAADVLNYFGDLAPVLANVRKMMPLGGLFAFSVEKLARQDGWELQESRRYCHSPNYVSAALEQAGFAAISVSQVVLRHDRDAPVEGLLLVAKAV